MGWCRGRNTEGGRKWALWEAPCPFHGHLRSKELSLSFWSPPGPFLSKSSLARPVPGPAKPWEMPHPRNQSTETTLCEEEIRMECSQWMRHHSALPMVVKVTRASCFLVTTPPKIASIGASQRAAPCVVIICTRSSSRLSWCQVKS